MQIRSIVKEPGKAAEERAVKNDMTALAGLVGEQVKFSIFRYDGNVVVLTGDKLPQGFTPKEFAERAFGTAVFAAVTVSDAGIDFCDMDELQHCLVNGFFDQVDDYQKTADGGS